MSNPKLTKKIIKSIVKECLIEVLAEGLASSDTSTQTPKSTKTLKQKAFGNFNSSDSSKRTPQRRESHLDSISYDQRKSEKNHRLDEIAKNVTSDPVLTEMLADTAHTTLQEQLAAESNKQFISPRSGDDAQRIVSNSNPEDIFGEETSGKWAQLAFGG